MQTLSAAQAAGLVNARGYDARQLFNTAATVEGADLRAMGMELTGPRGNRHILCATPDGRFFKSDIELWCDGVDYATAKIVARKSS